MYGDSVHLYFDSIRGKCAPKFRSPCGTGNWIESPVVTGTVCASI